MYDVILICPECGTEFGVRMYAGEDVGCPECGTWYTTNWLIRDDTGEVEIYIDRELI